MKKSFNTGVRKIKHFSGCNTLNVKHQNKKYNSVCQGVHKKTASKINGPDYCGCVIFVSKTTEMGSSIVAVGSFFQKTKVPCYRMCWRERSEGSMQEDDKVTCEQT